MLVKPMAAGVTCTVLMDCCHSGTVLDLPYKFAANDKRMTREKGFNMTVVREAVRPHKPTHEEITAARKLRRDKEREQAKRDKQAAKEAEMQGDPEFLGPKLADDGIPVLPTYRAPLPPGSPPRKKQPLTRVDQQQQHGRRHHRKDKNDDDDANNNDNNSSKPMKKKKNDNNKGSNNKPKTKNKFGNLLNKFGGQRNNHPKKNSKKQEQHPDNNEQQQQE